ncbi:MAG: hypothetical protein H6822_12900 [Planctomycetaceae bacterium]|nr:hypothetical protein [Planctomycetaceae bacterium]MCB9923075.1 hypothetical protein [Planctomycetaceae bacterium]
MQLLIQPNGHVRCLYDELIDLRKLGQMSVERGSMVEPDDVGNWFADLAIVNGPTLGPFTLRSQALAAERQWLECHWLLRS